MKKTKIICSIGPASNKPEIMAQMVMNGMNIDDLQTEESIVDVFKSNGNDVDSFEDAIDSFT